MGLPILQAYGMTETSAIISCDSIHHYRLGSVGKVLSNIECKINDPDENGVGIILVRGDNIARNVISQDGYLHTGDLGYLDKDGYLYIVGRKKRLIKLSNGKNVYPSELETLLAEHDMIDAAFVYEENGQIVATLASAHEISTLRPIVAEINKSLPHYKHICRFSVVDELREKLQ